MALLPLKLMARRGNWQAFTQRKRNPSFLELEQRILERDQHACRFCGFQSDRFQEVVNLDHDYDKNTTSTMVTACNLCAPCLFLDAVGPACHWGGTLIHLPELLQTDLNHFCRVLFCSLLRDSPYKGKLQSTYLTLQERSHPIEQFFGPKASEPHIFGQSVIDSRLDETIFQQPVFDEIRLLPNRKQLTEPVDYWKSSAFAHIPL